MGLFGNKKDKDKGTTDIPYEQAMMDIANKKGKKKGGKK